MSSVGKEILFSVIMPCYNSEDYVSNAIVSLKRQTYTNWELIVINDGSTDDTAGIIESYSISDDRITMYSKKNGGYVSAVNFGLPMVKGDYFMLMGSDDSLHCNLFDEIIRHIPAKLPDLIGFNTTKVCNGKNCMDDRTFISSFAIQFDSSIEKYESAFPKHSRIFFERDTSKLFKTSLLTGTLYLGSSGWDADGIFSMTLAHKAASFMSVPIAGYNWTLRSDSVSGRPVSVKVNLDRITNWKNYYDYLMVTYPKEITKREKDYITYFVQILEKYGMQDREISRVLHELVSGVKCIKKVCRTYNVNLDKDSHFFVKYPVIWLINRKLRKYIERRKHI